MVCVAEEKGPSGHPGAAVHQKREPGHFLKPCLLGLLICHLGTGRAPSRLWLWEEG